MKSPAVMSKKLQKRRSYPWDTWTKDDSTRRYVQGRHFAMTPRLFALICYNYGRRKGFTVISRVIDSHCVDIRFIKK